MKKALIVTTVSGFVPQFEMNNVKILQSLGYEVHYASNYKNPHYGKNQICLDERHVIKHQVDFVRTPFDFVANKKAFIQLKKVMEQEKPNLIHCHTPMGGVLARLVGAKYRKNGLKVIYTAHGFHFYKGAPFKNWLLYYPIEYMLAYQTDFLITITKEDYKRARKLHGLDIAHVYYVPGVGVSSNCEINKSRNIIRESFGWKDDKIIITSVGELNKNKNQSAVITALSQLSEMNIKYIICGEGEYFLQLKRLVHRYKMESRVEFLGYCENIEEILSATDIFVLPSYREGLSIALQEAMAIGLPIIATNIRGNRELVKDRKGGWLVPVGNIKALKLVLQEAIFIYKNNISVLKQMGHYNQKKVKAYSHSVVEQKIREIYIEAEKEEIDLKSYKKLQKRG